MKKIFLFLMLFVLSNIYSQSLTLQSITCSTATIRVDAPAIANGTYTNISYSVHRQFFTPFAGNSGFVNITMSGGVGTFTIPITSYYGYKQVTLKQLVFFNPFDGITGAQFYKDGWDIDFPLTITKQNQYLSSECLYTSVVDPDEPLYLLINESTCGSLALFGCGITSINNNFVPKYFEVTVQVTGANIGSFTTIYDSSNNNLTVPSVYYQNLGNTRFHIISMRELGTDTISSWGVDCDPVQIISFAPNTYFIDLTVQEFTPLFDFSNQNVSITNPICLNNNGTVTVTSSTLQDGLYDIQYFYAVNPYNIGDLIYSGTATNVNFVSGVGTFSIPTSTNNNGVGNYNFSPSQIQQAGGSCRYYFTSGSIPFTITNPPTIDISNTSISINDICLGLGGLVSFNSTGLVDGTYNINYGLSGSNISTQTANGVVVTSGTGTFTIPSSALTSAGTTTISLSGVENTLNGCVSSITPGTITDSFVVNALPNLSGTNTVSVAEPLCLGTGAMVSVNFPNLADGTYSLIYTLTGANASAGGVLVTGVNITSGLGSFVVLSSALTNTGTTTIEINAVSNEANTCTSYATGTITDSFVINALPNLTGTNSVAVTEPLCLGSNGTVTFNASALTNGTYSFIYTLTGANPSAGGVLVTGVNIASGTGTFTIPSSALTNAGTTTIEINAVSNEANTCTSYATGTITDSFVINALPNVTGGSYSVSVAEPICLGSNGTVTFNASALTNGTYNINYTLSGSNVGGQVATGVSIASGTGTFTIPSSALTNAGTTTISLSSVVASASGCTTTIAPGTITDSFVVSNSLNLTGTNSVNVTEPLCLGSNGAVTFNASALTNGTYNIAYTLSGANASTQTASGVVVASGTGTFTIPSSVLANAGTTTIEITTVIPSTGCNFSFTSGQVTDSFVINALPNVTGGTNSVAVTEPLCLGSNGTVTFNASAMANGTYNIAYTLSGANASTQTASGVVVASGTGTFTIPSSALTNAGTTTISLSNVVASASGCTTTITPGTITDSFVINALPNVTGGTNSVAVTEPLCLGSNGAVTFNASAMANGTYNIAYTLSGANASTQTASGVVVASGTGTFTIPSSALTNAGTTTISLSSVVASASGCTTTITPGTITDSFVINALPNVTGGTNSVAVTEPLCLGSNGAVTFNASAMANGTYNIAYTLSGANASTQTASGVVVASGTGTFTIPSSALTNAGTTTISLSNVVASASGCTTTITPGTITDSFVINALPNVTGGTNSVAVTEPLCLGSNGAVTFNASAMANGTYNIAYTLSGANASTQTASGVVVASGTGTFTIPSSALTNAGTTTISLTSIEAESTCTAIFNTSVSDTFEVGDRPVLSGAATQNFCKDANATINDLVVNFSGVNWYDSETSTTPLDGTTILVDGVTYYGEAINSLTGCTSEIRLEVTANITSCEFLIPDGFSPNNDGVNDVYNIVNGNLYYPNYSIEVYDRYGSLIHKGKNWDGTYNGKLLPASVYFIIVNYNDNSKKPTQHRIYLNK